MSLYLFQIGLTLAFWQLRCPASLERSTARTPCQMKKGWPRLNIITPSTNGISEVQASLDKFCYRFFLVFLLYVKSLEVNIRSMIARADGLAWTTAEPLRSNPHLWHLRSRFQGGPTSWPEGPRRSDRKLRLGNAKHEKWWWWWWWWSLSYLLGCKGWRWSIKCCKGHGLRSLFSFELYAWTATCQEKGPVDAGCKSPWWSGELSSLSLSLSLSRLTSYAG